MAHSLKDTGHEGPVGTGLDGNKEGESAQEQEQETDIVSEEEPKRKDFFFFLKFLF